MNDVLFKKQKQGYANKKNNKLGGKDDIFILLFQLKLLIQPQQPSNGFKSQNNWVIL